MAMPDLNLLVALDVLLAEGSTFGTTRFNSLFQGSAPHLPDCLEGGMVTCSFFDALGKIEFTFERLT